MGLMGTSEECRLVLHRLGQSHRIQPVRYCIVESENIMGCGLICISYCPLDDDEKGLVLINVCISSEICVRQ
jgi:hypothetical protein